METNPSIERLSALLAPAARCDTDGIGRTLYHVAKADLIFDQKPWQPNTVRFPRLRLRAFRVLSFHRPSSRNNANETNSRLTLRRTAKMEQRRSVSLRKSAVR
jgi:hypothetical protein